MYIEALSRQPAISPRPTPLLFVHGGNHTAWYWTNFLEYFAEKGYRAYALNLRGHGGSEGGEGLRWARLSDFVEDVAQVAAGLSLPPVVIGHSLGGLVVQKYLESHPASAGILLAPVPAGSLRPFLRLIQRHPGEWLRAALTLSPESALRKPGLLRDCYFSAACPEEIVDECYRQIQAESLLALLEMMAFGLQRARGITVPILVLGAAADAVIRPAEVARTAHAYGTQAVIFPGMAHHMMLVPGWPVVAERMLAWLAEQGL